MKIAIVGFNTEGRATYDYFLAHGHDLTICDQNPDLEVPGNAAAILGDDYLDNLDRFDLIVRTAGMHPRKILEKNPEVAGKITTHVNEFFKASPTRNIISVTGTKGKGTTSTLITNILEADGKTVRLGGNIGVPPLTFIDELDTNSWVVLELSSYQLIDFNQAPHLAVCLMIAPEHLDWHTDLEEYITAKEQLFARQGTADVAIYYHENSLSKRIAGAGQGQKVPYYYSPGAEVIPDTTKNEGGIQNGTIVIDGNTICRTDELKLLGRHNWQNACAAITAVWYACLEVCGLAETPNIAAMREVLTSFSGLPFRIEYRGEVHGIAYYNDSFASAPPAPLAAIQAIPQKQVVIIGGYDRRLPLDDLAAGLLQHQDKIRHILLIGAAKARLASVLQAADVPNFTISEATGMPAIVQEATGLAQTGDAVVLSPGFPSFDMFNNFEDRGRQFNAALEQL
jgi:UDP-N-acetylmuramoylalanine--D-glutamate ligase